MHVKVYTSKEKFKKFGKIVANGRGRWDRYCPAALVCAMHSKRVAHGSERASWRAGGIPPFAKHDAKRLREADSGQIPGSAPLSPLRHQPRIADGHLLGGAFIAELLLKEVMGAGACLKVSVRLAPVLFPQVHLRNASTISHRSGTHGTSSSGQPAPRMPGFILKEANWLRKLYRSRVHGASKKRA